ncbi:DUF2271 domain-containing protein [Parabacteroides sp. PF5-9]|uniref:DUF2271 domain-containing protein n=1 Tax=Parabacteroides sp. PF5-9 TaxID=1742404 RepID=UPI002475BA1C|nr:DUF2271 domain-containing protein [Parabacteroides sp. PF5-9]MDH6357301.1 hypothetical protein [Parabacteroides sp. PF5-9]
MNIKLFSVIFLLFAGIPMVSVTAEVNENERSADMANAPGTLSISFNYARNDGKGSNQYAIWIEDAQGNVVKNVYVTNFTGKGGHATRPVVPTWVKKASPAQLTESQLDAFTGATPVSGLQTYTWDGTNNNGEVVSNGNYRFFVEATLFGPNRVVFSGSVKVGAEKQESIPVTTELFAEAMDNRDMLTDVKATYMPK